MRTPHMYSIFSYQFTYLLGKGVKQKLKSTNKSIYNNLIKKKNYN